MYNDFYQEEELMSSLSSFEQALEHNESKYFEVHEFEYIIDHYISAQNITSSKNAIQKALIIHPKSHEIQKRLAQVKNMEGQYESAIETLNNSFVSFGTDKDLDYFLILGESFLGIGENKKARDAFSRAIELSEEEYFDIVTTVAALYQQEGYFEEVIYYLKSVENEDSSLLFDIGMSYHNLLDNKNAILYLEKFINQTPFSVDGWYYLGKSYQDSNRLEDAEDAFLNTIALDSELIIYQYDLAKVYIDQSKYLEALEVYKEILSKDKNVNHSIFLSIGDISYNLEQFDNAKKNYEIAIRLNPESAEGYYSLAQVEIENESLELAKSFIQKAISIDANKAAFFVTLGTINQLMGDVKSAEFSYLEAVNIDSNLNTAWHLLIDYYFFLDKPQESIDVAFKSLANIDEEYSIYCKIAASFFDLDDTEQAVYYLKKAINIDSDARVFFKEYYSESDQNIHVKTLLGQL